MEMNELTVHAKLAKSGVGATALVGATRRGGPERKAEVEVEVQKSVKCSHCFLQQSLSASSQDRNQTTSIGDRGTERTGCSRIGRFFKIIF